MDGAPMGFGLEAEFGALQSDSNINDNGIGENQFEEYYQEASHGDYDEDEVEVGNEESVPTMPNEFYSEVDNFLSKPPPKVKGIKAKSKTREKLEEKIVKSSSLPILVNKPKKLRVASKIDTGRNPGKQKKSKQPIDTNLLAEAMQYVEQVQRESLIEECKSARVPQDGGKKSGSAPQDPQGGRRGAESGGGRRSQEDAGPGIAYSSTQGRSKAKSAKAAAQKKKKENMVRRLRSQTEGRSKENSSFDTSMTTQDGGSLRNAVDFDALVANFEQGLTLQRLKEELEESKASMARSNKAMQQISKEASSQMRL